MAAASVKVDFKWLAHGEGLDLPCAQSQGAAGLDLCAAIARDEVVSLGAGKRAIVPCGFSIALPIGFEAQLRPRSGLAARHGVTVLNSPGTIDADYRGEIKVILINHGDSDFEIRRGDRIAQIIVAPVSACVFEIQTQLDDTLRGAGGFGSTDHVATQ